ncbi:hypothetical protein HZB04_00970 [Candidatus Wolfebacteria bacterium]|nr:hypothetical protein [Candidatus Wolfebacteria bacterium]
MKLGHKEIIAIAGLTILSCNPQKAPDSELANGAGTTRAKISETLNPGKSVPTEADLTKSQLTATCTPAGQPLSGKQFPMRRGTELIKTLGDGTCLERLRDGNDKVIYAISGNRKIKFANPNSNQEARILGKNNFVALQNLGIDLMEEIYAEAVASLTRHPLRTKERAKPLRVLFEGPMDECPTYRYRRGMLADLISVIGSECIWDERSITCPTVTTATDSSYREWNAFVEGDQHIIPDTGTHLSPNQLSPGIAPKPQQWLGNQPECPKPNSVVNKDL